MLFYVGYICISLITLSNYSMDSDHASFDNTVETCLRSSVESCVIRDLQKKIIETNGTQGNFLHTLKTVKPGDLGHLVASDESFIMGVPTALCDTSTSPNISSKKLPMKTFNQNPFDEGFVNEHTLSDTKELKATRIVDPTNNHSYLSNIIVVSKKDTNENVYRDNKFYPTTQKRFYGYMRFVPNTSLLATLEGYNKMPSALRIIDCNAQNGFEIHEEQPSNNYHRSFTNHGSADIKTYEMPKGNDYYITFNHDGTRMATLITDVTHPGNISYIHLWNIRNANPLKKIEEIVQIPVFDDKVEQISFQGDKLIATSDRGYLMMFSGNNGTMINKQLAVIAQEDQLPIDLKKFTNETYTVASSCNSFLVTASYNENPALYKKHAAIKIWDLNTGNLLSTVWDGSKSSPVTIMGIGIIPNNQKIMSIILSRTSNTSSILASELITDKQNDEIRNRVKATNISELMELYSAIQK